MAMDAILATIADGGRAVSEKTESNCRIKLITLLFLRFSLNRASTPSPYPSSASPLRCNGRTH